MLMDGTVMPVSGYRFSPKRAGGHETLPLGHPRLQAQRDALLFEARVPVGPLGQEAAGSGQEQPAAHRVSVRQRAAPGQGDPGIGGQFDAVAAGRKPRGGQLGVTGTGRLQFQCVEETELVGARRQIELQFTCDLAGCGIEVEVHAPLRDVREA
jgi:hypothetical protein